MINPVKKLYVTRQRLWDFPDTSGELSEKVGELSVWIKFDSEGWIDCMMTQLGKSCISETRWKQSLILKENTHGSVTHLRKN